MTTGFPRQRAETVDVAGIRWDVPARFRYEDTGPGDYRYFAHAEKYSLMTNGRGKGLFLWDDRGNIHQIKGTLQFGVRSLEQFKRKLRQWLYR